MQPSLGLGQQADLPQDLLDLLATLPTNSDREGIAALVTKHFFPTTRRTVEGWRLSWRYPNGKAIAPTREALEYAYRKMRAASVPIGSSRRRSTAEAL
jgi:hypothetical protein